MTDFGIQRRGFALRLVFGSTLNVFLHKWFGRFRDMKLFDRGPEFENNLNAIAPFEKWLAMDYYRMVQKR